jgi:transposase InsO family protein
MDEERIKEQAMQRYENGESAKSIYESLGKGKTWFFKWLKRFKSGSLAWAKEQSRKPYNSPKKIVKSMEQAIIEKRQELEQTLYSQIGALNISWQLGQEGTALPSMATINRVIKRNNLTRKKPRYVPKGVDYPGLEPTHSNFLHQFDSIGPRYLKSDGRFYSGNIIDAYDRRCTINPMRAKTRKDITDALIRSWQMLGIPTYLQMDNMLQTQGSHRHPHSFGLVIRLCLGLGIQPLFIPIKEPWRNGIVERFNNDFDKMFFRAQFFKNFLYLCQQAKGFETFHNENHRYSTMHGKTPKQQTSGNIRLLPKNFKIPKELTIADGYIHLIRFIRSNRILDIFGEKFAMPMSVEYEYVWATIDTQQEKLFIYHDKKLIKELIYPLPKTPLDLSKIDL